MNPLKQWLEEHTSPKNAYKASCDFIASYESQLPQSLGMVKILERGQCDEDLLCAALLYPILAQDSTLLLNAEKQFDKSIIKLVRGAIQMEIIHLMKREQAESLRKMMLAMVDDIRVVLLKLAERLFLISHLENKAPGLLCAACKSLRNGRIKIETGRRCFSLPLS